MAETTKKKPEVNTAVTAARGSDTPPAAQTAGQTESRPPVTESNGTSTPKKRAPRKPAADPNESKADRFKRLGTKRVPRAVKAITAVANLANKGQYEYTAEQLDKVVVAIKEAVRDMEQRFRGGKAGAESFTL